MTDALKRIFDAGERLRGVVEHRDHELAGDIVQIELRFDRSSFVLSATGEDEVSLDEVVSTQGHETTPGGAAWASATGHRLFDFWQMTNKQGYSDAFQLSFADDTSEPQTLIQLQAMASRLAVFAVTGTGV